MRQLLHPAACLGQSVFRVFKLRLALRQLQLGATLVEGVRLLDEDIRPAADELQLSLRRLELEAGPLELLPRDEPFLEQRNQAGILAAQPRRVPLRELAVGPRLLHTQRPRAALARVDGGGGVETLELGDLQLDVSPTTGLDRARQVVLELARFEPDQKVAFPTSVPSGTRKVISASRPFNGER